jgi:hypothetical protein
MAGRGRVRRHPGAPAAILITAVAAAVVGCSAGVAPAASTDGSGLQAVVVTTSTWAGRATVLIALEEADGSPVGATPMPVTARFENPVADASRAVEATGRIVRPPGGQRDLVRFEATLPDPGRWQVTVATGTRHATTSLQVRDAAGLPVRGTAAPSVVTPTANDVLFDYAKLTPDPHPNPAFYGRSVAAALKAGLPFVLVLDSAGFLETPACGSALSILHRTALDVPGLTVIHVEPYLTRLAAGSLTLDPPDGPARLAPWSVAWGLDAPELGTGSIPWIFVVDADGVVHAVFQGVMGSEEIALAMADVRD